LNFGLIQVTFVLVSIVLTAVPQEHGGHGDPTKTVETLLDRVRPLHASGTAWQPAQTPVTAMHSRIEGWHVMAHAAVFGVYDYQTGDRGEDAFFSTNWLMVMGHRPWGGGEVLLRGMISVEEITVGDRGYPLLLQSGEGLHDRQHPHDLFMELAAGWSAPLSDSIGVQFYGGIVGEPALGPVTFHHRHSAAADPIAPLGHHWQDSTHISPGVLTGGLFTSFAKLEASWFNGREPDNNRLDLDLDVPDSGAVRLSLNPTPFLSMQLSAARLDEPERDEEGVSVRRATASVTGTGKLGLDGAWSAAVVWGRNAPSEGPTTDAFLAEANVELDGVHTVFGRAEALRKSGHDLDLGPALNDETFPILSLSLGYLYTFTRLQDQEIALGIMGTANVLDRDLEAFYGDGVEYGVLLFLRLRPAPISGSGRQGRAR
jgi:hypothetical protein